MSNQTTRVAVIDPDGQPVMPTTPSRARKWMTSGKAVGKRNKLGVFYVQLTQKPSGYETQPIVAGTDRGKAFTGIAFQSKLATIAIVPSCPSRLLQVQEEKVRPSICNRQNGKKNGAKAHT